MLALFCLISGAHGQVVQLAFERHTILSNDCGPRRTNIVITSSGEVPVATACTTTRGKFSGSLKLEFPASLANVTNFFLAEPVRFSVGVSGNWTIENRFNEQNFGQANFLTTRVRVLSRPCDITTTNPPPAGVGIFPVEAKVDCASSQFLPRRETSGLDYIVEFESEVELLYRNATTTHESVRYTIVSRYRAPGGPYLFANTNLISLAANPRFPLPGLGTTVFNQGTADLNYTVSGSASWLKISGAGTLARDRSVTVNGTFDTNALSAGLHRGAIEIKGDGPNPAISVPVELNVLRDSLALLSVDPAPGTLFTPGSLVRFSGRVEASLQTASFADIVLSLRDQAGNTIEAAVVNLRTTTGIFTTNITLPSTPTRSVIIPTTSANVSLVSLLRDPFGGRTLAEAEAVQYPIGTPDEILQANLVPPVTESILNGSTTNVSAEVTYFLQTRPEADLALRVFDQKGVLQASSGDPANPSQFLRVRRSDGRKTVRLTTSNFTVARDATNLMVRAVLIDPLSATVLKSSSTNIYRVGSYGKIKKIEFGAARPGFTTVGFIPAIEQGPILEAQVPFTKQQLAPGGLRRAIAVTYDFEPRGKPASMFLAFGERTPDGRLTNVGAAYTAFYGTNDRETLDPGLDQRMFFFDPFFQDRPSDSIDALEFGVEMLEHIDEEYVPTIAISDILTMPINRLRADGEIVPKQETELVSGRPATFSVPLELSFKGPEASRRLVFEVRVNTQAPSGKTGRIISRTVLATIPAKTTERRHPEVTIDVPPDANYLAIQFFLDGDPNTATGSLVPTHWARTDPFYYRVQAAPLMVQPAQGQNFDFGAGQLLDVASSSQRSITPRLGLNDVKSVLPNAGPPVGPLSAPGPSASSGTIVAPSDFVDGFISHGKSVQFSPAIPENGGFSARLVMRYDRETFPDDPNFAESRLEIVSVDPASGIVRRYPTTVDQAAQSATASISGLASYYGLGVFGPFTSVALNLPAAGPSAAPDGKIRIVNLSPNTASFAVRSEAAADFDFTTNSASIVTRHSVASAQMLSLAITNALATNGSWIQLQADQRSILAWQTHLRAGHQVELKAMESRATSLLLPEIEHGPDASTELHLANTGRSGNRLTLELYDAEGRLRGTNQVTLIGKENFFRRLPDLFQITNAFRGHLIARGGQELSAVALRIGRNSVAALESLPLGAGAGPVRLRSARFSSGGPYSSLLNIVNLGNRSASVRVAVTGGAGTDLANAATLTLAGRQQVQTNLAQLFSFGAATTTTGAITVESTEGGVAATLTTLDASGQDAFRSSVLLSSQPLRHGAFPFASVSQNETIELSVLNHGSTPAAVTVKSFGANGISVASTNFTVAAAGHVTRNLSPLIPAGAASSEGYVVIDSDQPIFAAAARISSDGRGFRDLLLQRFETAGPRLEGLQIGNEIHLSWPASEGGYTLQATDVLGPAANWQTAAHPVSVRGGRNTVVTPLDPQARFYRLIKR